TGLDREAAATTATTATTETATANSGTYDPEKYLTETDSPLGRLRHALPPVSYEGGPGNWSAPPGRWGADRPQWRAQGRP
ncbi:hypothetical protein P8605_49690, partial [Streptomyces sp. T-3]|nr:hypothetical protein [Streptomyces sp. T-3]